MSAELLNLVKPEDARHLRSAYGTFPTGVVAVAAEIGGTPVGMAASSFTSVSVDPALVSVSFDNGSSTWPALRSSSRLGISVLAEGQEALCRQLSSRTGDRFAGASTLTAPDGSIFIDGSASWLEVRLVEELRGGDHSIGLFEVLSLRIFDDVTPLIFHGSQFRTMQQVLSVPA